MMFVHYQDCVSPHQIPLALEIARRVGPSNFRYVYRDENQAERSGMGWNLNASEDWCLHIGSHPDETLTLLENAEMMLTGMRDVGLFERRAAKGLLTLYQTERWFKPFHGLPGKLRLLIPSYRKMARRFAHLVQTSDKVKVLPIGVHAQRDMLTIGVPSEKMTLWGYFVAASALGDKHYPRGGHSPLRVIWVGRQLTWKKVDTLLRAVAVCQERFPITLTMVGNGPERERLEKLGKCLFVHHPEALKMKRSVPIDEIRQLMQAHDVYVLTSDAQEGWGAVVSEALEEGMQVFGTFEAGSSATLLPKANLFPAGDWRRLAQLLADEQRGKLPRATIGEWSASAAAKRLLEAVRTDGKIITHFENVDLSLK